MNLHDLANRVREVSRHLGDNQAGVDRRAFRDPMDELVGTILSQNTSDLNSERAMRALKAKYESWEAVAEAPIDDLADCIRSGGLARVKASRILATLDAVRRTRGDLNLSFLSTEPLEQAIAWLEKLPGVGRKTASCVMLFSFGAPAMPVDTHVQRVARRLGLAGPASTPTKISEILEHALPPSDILSFHLNVIALGRTICKAGRPRCDACPLAPVCPRIGVVPKSAIMKAQVTGRGSGRAG